MKCFADTIKDEAYRYKLFREGVPIFAEFYDPEPMTEEEQKKWEEEERRAPEELARVQEYFRKQREENMRKAKNG